MLPPLRTAARATGMSAARWVVVFAGATAGAYAGRVAAALLYNEPVSPLLDGGPRAMLEQDVAPGFLTAEVIGRGLGLGLAGEALIAALGAGVSAIATGPLTTSENGGRQPSIVAVHGRTASS